MADYGNTKAGEGKSKKIVIKRYCPQCGEYKSVFDTDDYGRTICVECSHLLDKREVDLNA